VLGNDGKPQPVSVRLGATDGAVTEIASGQVDAGREVVIGGGPRPVETAASPARPPARFGF
jgi:HlyD family secretion protein